MPYVQNSSAILQPYDGFGNSPISLLALTPLSNLAFILLVHAGILQLLAIFWGHSHLSLLSMQAVHRLRDKMV